MDQPPLNLTIIRAPVKFNNHSSVKFNLGLRSSRDLDKFLDPGDEPRGIFIWPQLSVKLSVEVDDSLI